MWKHLESLRQRPEEQKKLIALTVAGTITLIILVTWISTRSFSLSPNNDNVTQAQTASPTQSIKAQWNTFMQTVKGRQTIEKSGQ